MKSLKSLWIVVFLACVALAGIAVTACGPEQTYCYDQMKTCVQAKAEKDSIELQKMLDEIAAKADAGQSSDH